MSEAISSVRRDTPRWRESTLPWHRDVHLEHRVLLVDDGRPGHVLLERVAGTLGAAVHHARSIADAVRHALKFTYDAVIVDAVLGGRALIPLLGQLGTLQRSAAVLLSGEARRFPDDFSLEGNLLGTLRKPWDEQELEEALRRAFELSRCRRSERPRAPTAASFGRLLLVAKQADARLITRLLGQGAPADNLVHAASLTEAIALCGQQTFDLVLTDVCLPDACGLDAVIRIRRALPQPPIVALTATEDIAFSDQALQVGAQDVLVKPRLGAEELLRALGHAVSRQRAQNHLHHGALHDELTSLAKRTLLHQRIQNALARSRRMGNTFAVVYIDLDHFKFINDTHGHAIGDAVLISVSQRLRAAVREYDTVARLGGDEFAILLDSLDDPAEAEMVAQRVLDSLSRPVQVESRDLDVTASIGISVFPDGGDGVDELLRTADRAMYSAKRAGRNTYSLAPLGSEAPAPLESGPAPVSSILASRR